MKKKIITPAAAPARPCPARPRQWQWLSLIHISSTHMITFSNAELSDKEKDMIENNSNYSTASIVGGSAKLVKEEREMCIRDSFLQYFFSVFILLF